MPIAPPSSETPIQYSIQDIILDALIEIGMLSPGEQPGGDTVQWAFRKANLVLDTWSARKNYVPFTTFAAYTLTPNLSPHTIGPGIGATFNVPQRPVKVMRATLILNNVSPVVEIPLNIKDEQWWMDDVSIKGLTSQNPTDLFYSADFPNGSLYFWPVPKVAYGVRLNLWGLLAQFASITDEIGGPGSSITTMPPGYRNALMLTLAETLCSGGEKEASQTLIASAAAARLAVFGNNSPTVRMSTRDSGVPGAHQSLTESNFNYKSRSFS